MPIHPSRAAALAALAALAATPAAQETQSYEQHYLVGWPAGLPEGAFRRIAIGRFGNDLGTQILALREDDSVPPEGKPVLAFEPAGYTDAVWALPTTSDWSDAAVLRGAGAGGRDRILYSDGNGLSSTEYDDAGGLHLTQLLVDGGVDPSWVAADQLTVVDLDGDGDDDLAGRDATHREVMTMLDTGAGFTPGPTFSFAVEVTAFTVGDFNRDSGNVELCVLIPNRIRFYDVATQALLKAWTAAVGGGCVTTIGRHDGYVGDLAVIAADLGGTGDWELFAADTLHLEPSVDLFLAPDVQTAASWVEPTSLTALDHDFDGDRDILMRVLDHQVAYVLATEWDSQSSHFDGSYQAWALGPSPSSATPQDRIPPAVGKRYPGGPQPLAFGLDFVGRLYVYPDLGGTFAEGTTAAIAFYGDADWTPGAQQPPQDGTLTISIQYPPQASLFDYVQVIAWRQQNPYTGNKIEQMARTNLIFDITAGEGRTCEVPLEEYGTFWTSRRHYYVTARLVNATSGSGNTAVITSAGEYFLAGTTIPVDDDDPGFDDYLSGLPGFIEYELVHLPSYAGGGTPVGAYVTLGSIPGFENLPPIQPVPTFAGN